VLGEFDRGAHQVALVFFELGLETLEQRKGIGGTAGEADQHLAVIDLAHLARSPFHDDVAEGDLAVAAKRDVVAASYRQDGGAVKLFHAGLWRMRARNGKLCPCPENDEKAAGNRVTKLKVGAPATIARVPRQAWRRSWRRVRSCAGRRG